MDLITTSDIKEDFKKRIFRYYGLMNAFRKRINGNFKVEFEEPDYMGVYKKGSQYHAYFEMGALQQNLFETNLFKRSEGSTSLIYSGENKVALKLNTVLETDESEIIFTPKEDGYTLQGEWILRIEYEDIKGLLGSKPSIALVDNLLHHLFKFSTVSFEPKFKPPKSKKPLYLKLDGSILYIPYIDNSAEFLKKDQDYQALRFSEDPEDRKEYEKAVHPVGGQIILTDFDNNVVYRSTKKGKIIPFLLHGAQSVGSSDLVDLLEKGYTRDDMSFLYNIDRDLGSQIDDYMIGKSISGHEYGNDVDFTNLVNKAYKLILDKLPEVISRFSPYRAFKNLAMFKTLRDRAKDFIELKEKRDAQQVINKTQDFNIATVPEIPMVKQEVDLFPHQGLTLSKIEDQDHSVLDLDTGAGKTLLLLSDALIQLEKGKISRPCLIMPNATIAQQILEFNEFTDNKLNIIVINSETERKQGLKKLAEISIKAPINTIILASYEWISKGPNPIDTGMKIKGEKVWKKNFSRADYLTKTIGVDMVSWDEVHFVKNSKSQRSQACKQVSAPSVKIKRGATGTIMPNRPEDIVTIAGLIDSSIFKSQEEFAATFSNGVSKNGKVERWNEDAPKKIKARLQDSGGLTLRNSHWRYLMPKMITKVHHVTMSKEQKLLYDNILEDVLSSIKEDPKLAKLWAEIEDSDELDLDISDALFSKLSRIDQYLTNPNTEDFIEFAQENNLPALDGLDLVSPKVAKINEILASHFSKDKNGKVIVMCNAKSGAQHILENLDMKANALYYDAGVKESLDRLEADDNVKVLVSVSQSLDTGLNLQHANRLIMVNLDWSVGKDEQKKGRIFRPGQKRDVFIDYVLTDESAEITKFARLVSKKHIIRQITSDYDDRTNFEPIRMNIDTMLTMNQYEQLEPFIARDQDIYNNELTESERFQTYYSNRMPEGVTMIANKTTGKMLEGGKVIPELQVPQLKRLKQIMRSRGMTLEEDVKKQNLNEVKDKLKTLKTIRKQRLGERKDLQSEIKTLQKELKEEPKKKLQKKLKLKIDDLKTQLLSVKSADRKEDLQNRLATLNDKLSNLEKPKQRERTESRITKLENFLLKLEKKEKLQKVKTSKRLKRVKKKLLKKKLLKKKEKTPKKKELKGKTSKRLERLRALIKEEEDLLKKKGGKKKTKKTKVIPAKNKLNLFFSNFGDGLEYMSVLKTNKNLRKIKSLGFNEDMILFWKEVKNKAQAETLLRRIKRKKIKIFQKTVLSKQISKSRIFKFKAEASLELTPITLPFHVRADEGGPAIIYFLEHNNKAYLAVDQDEVERSVLSKLRSLGFKRRKRAFYVPVTKTKAKRIVKMIEKKKIFIKNKPTLENMFFLTYRQRL